MGLYLGVFLVTLSGLLFEIALTRIFSATIWYHYAFVAIAVALLGWGLGGFALHLLRHRLTFSHERVAWLTLLYALSLPLGLWLMFRLPLHPERLAFYFLVSLLPFFLAGMALSMAFALYRERAGQLYFADLLGAALGALAVTLLLSWLGGENTVLAVALAPALGAACFSRRLLAPALALAAVLALVLATNDQTGLLRIRSAPTKGLYKHLAATPGAEIVLTGWNAYSRVDAVTGFEPPYLARLYIDSDAWTNVLEWDGQLESAADMRGWYRALPFELLPPRPKTLVIGPGGGSDVLVALAAGSERVIAVEMNPLMLRFARHFGERAGHLYDHPQVEAVLDEGRSFVARSARSFDAIVLGFVDSWAAVASGGLSLSENHLYTVEAFRDYQDRLTPDGMLVILRWHVDVPRLVANAVALLGAEGAGRRMAVLMERTGQADDPPQMIFMLRRRPFSAEETAAMLGWEDVRPLIVPGRHVEEPYASLLSGRKTLAEYDAEARYRADPVTDDRPFFFARQKPWGLPDSMKRAFLTILLPVGVGSVALVAFGKPRGERVAPYLASVLYFSCLGLGFITVELGLLHRLTLLLGHPIFTLSILLFTLLACGGLGSHFSPRFAPASACLAVAGLGLGYTVVLPLVVPALLPLPLVARIAVAVVLVAPLGFAMGMPFPRGLQMSGRGPLPAPPFYWGLNGVFSVVGSMATMVVAVTVGFTPAMAAGCACYLVAAAAARGMGAVRPAP
jgi:predicted membrane-bound spermidine synthase